MSSTSSRQLPGAVTRGEREKKREQFKGQYELEWGFQNVGRISYKDLVLNRYSRGCNISFARGYVSGHDFFMRALLRLIIRLYRVYVIVGKSVFHFASLPKGSCMVCSHRNFHPVFSSLFLPSFLPSRAGERRRQRRQRRRRRRRRRHDELGEPLFERRGRSLARSQQGS